MENMNRREFLAGAGAALAFSAIPEEAEAFGALSQESFEEYVDTMEISKELGGEDTRDRLKKIYERLSSGQKRFYTMALFCSMGGTPVLEEFDSETGSVKVVCKQ